jgi:uncharacterized repeat protein (TIGR01451 family)
MSNENVNKSRRVLLNTTLGVGALGAVLPSTWTKPLVNAVVLPVHAMTSPIYSFSVEKTQSGGANPAMVVGDVIEYSIVVTNTGDTDLTGVVATDTLPDGTVVVLSGEVESLATDGVLEVNETWTYATTYTVTEADIISGAALTNSVSVVTNEAPEEQDDSVDTPVVPVVCPDITIGNVVIGPAGSGAVICSLTFDVFSSDSTPLTVTGITNTALSTDAAVTYEAFPAIVTDVVGTRVAWTGGFTTPECQLPFFSSSAVDFTVTATCEGALDPITMDFNLADIAALA